MAGFEEVVWSSFGKLIIFDLDSQQLLKKRVQIIFEQLQFIDNWYR